MADFKLELPNCTLNEKIEAVRLYCIPATDRTDVDQKRLEYLVKKGNQEK